MVGIIDYEAGNIRSVVNALKVLGVQYVVSNNLNELMKATKIILPGVGEARSAMLSLQRVGLIEWIKNLNVPFLGICLGMQILFESSTERNTTCLGIVNGTIDHFSVANKKLKIPHMGWNDVHIIRDSPLFAHIPSGTYFYFVHSYFAPRTDVTIGETTYGVPFASAIHYKNFFGVQFHPEKSSTSGLQLLKNFVELC